MDEFKLYDPISLRFGYNEYSIKYMEEKRKIDEDPVRFMGLMKTFFSNIQSLRTKTASSFNKYEGDITKHDEYDKYLEIEDFLKNHIGSNTDVKNLVSLHELLRTKFKKDYIRAYENKNSLLMAEFETGAFLLFESVKVIGLESLIFTSNNKFIKYGNASKLTFAKKPILLVDLKKFVGTISKNEHREYIDLTNELAYQTFQESAGSKAYSLVEDIIKLVNFLDRKFIQNGKMAYRTLKNTIFAIIPIMQNIMYRKYKKNVQKILSLEDLANLLEMNIKTVEVDKNLSEEERQNIIKKQQAMHERLIKKAAKMRAEIIKRDNEIVDTPIIDKKPSDEKNDDFEFFEPKNESGGNSDEGDSATDDSSEEEVDSDE